MIFLLLRAFRNVSRGITKLLPRRFPTPGGYIMKLRTAENIDPAEGKSEDILFCERLIECGLFKSGTILPTGFGLRLRRASRGRILRHWIFSTGSTAAPDA